MYIMSDIKDEYNQEAYSWYDFKVNWDYSYVDSCHFLDDNHFHILFDDSTPPSIENTSVTNQELVMTTSVQFSYSPVVLFLPNSSSTLANYVDGYTYYDPHDQCRPLYQHPIEF
jgi:hypothetical protein